MVYGGLLAPRCDGGYLWGPEAEHKVSTTETCWLWAHVARSQVVLAWWDNGCKIFVVVGFLLTLCISFNFVDLLSKIS